MNKSSDEIVEYGRSNICRIAYAKRSNGAMLAKEFLESLKVGDRIKFVNLFDRMLEHGRIVNKEKFWKLRGESELWEFKAKPYRVLTFREGQTWFLTHGFRKDSEDTPRGEIKKGIRIRKEHLER